MVPPPPPAACLRSRAKKASSSGLAGEKSAADLRVQTGAPPQLEIRRPFLRMTEVAEDAQARSRLLEEYADNPTHRVKLEKHFSQ